MPEQDIASGASRSEWPLQKGFDRFYGLEFRQAKLLTIHDGGEPSWLLAMFRAVIGQQQLITTGEQVLRGQIGRFLKGLSPGGLAYGYRLVQGDPGKREIDPDQAKVIERIFTEFASGMSAHRIAAGLNRDGIKPPRRGTRWNQSTIIGNKQRGTGILGNVNYVGVRVFNRLAYVINPETSKRNSRPKPKEELYTQSAPELRIIDDDLWNDVQRLRKVTRPGPPRDQRRPRRLLSGLLKCGQCGANYIVVQGDWACCSGRKNAGTCTNTRHFRMSEIEERVLEALGQKLLEPETVRTGVEAFRRRSEELARESGRSRREIERELAAVQRGKERILEAIMSGNDGLSTLTAKLQELENRERDLQARLPAPEKVIALHPRAADAYRQMIENVQTVLSGGDATAHQAVSLVRNLILRITVRPEEDPVGLIIHGDLAVLMGIDPLNASVGCGGRI